MRDEGWQRTNKLYILSVWWHLFHSHFFAVYLTRTHNPLPNPLVFCIWISLIQFDAATEKKKKSSTWGISSARNNVNVSGSCNDVEVKQMKWKLGVPKNSSFSRYIADLHTFFTSTFIALDCDLHFYFAHKIDTIKIIFKTCKFSSIDLLF